jgi:probable rRNA maturation factor
MQLALWLELEEFPLPLKEEVARIIALIPHAVEKAVDRHLTSERYNVILSSDEFIRHLNRDFRGKDSVTDVLSFPLGSDEEVTGEIYICWSRVLSQAEEYDHSWQREFSFLLIHGVLHLLGFEHGEEPNPEMRTMEERILDILGLGR